MSDNDKFFDALAASAKKMSATNVVLTYTLKDGRTIEQPDLLNGKPIEQLGDQYTDEEKDTITKIVSGYQATPENIFKPASVQYQPPLLAVYLPYLLLPKKNRVALLGDLEEEYQEAYARFGSKLANVWFWKQVLWSLCPLWNGWLAKYGAKVADWGKGVVAEAIKRKMG